MATRGRVPAAPCPALLRLRARRWLAPGCWRVPAPRQRRYAAGAAPCSLQAWAQGRQGEQAVQVQARAEAGVKEGSGAGLSRHAEGRSPHARPGKLPGTSSPRPAQRGARGLGGARGWAPALRCALQGLWRRGSTWWAPLLCLGANTSAVTTQGGGSEARGRSLARRVGRVQRLAARGRVGRGYLGEREDAPASEQPCALERCEHLEPKLVGWEGATS